MVEADVHALHLALHLDDEVAPDSFILEALHVDAV
jgi:hypothetical protein